MSSLLLFTFFYILRFLLVDPHLHKFARAWMYNVFSKNATEFLINHLWKVMKSPRVVKVAVGRDRDHIPAHKFNILQVVEKAVLGEEVIFVKATVK